MIGWSLVVVNGLEVVLRRSLNDVRFSGAGGGNRQISRLIVTVLALVGSSWWTTSPSKIGLGVDHLGFHRAICDIVQQKLRGISLSCVKF